MRSHITFPILYALLHVTVGASPIGQVPCGAIPGIVNCVEVPGFEPHPYPFPMPTGQPPTYNPVPAPTSEPPVDIPVPSATMVPSAPTSSAVPTPTLVEIIGSTVPAPTVDAGSVIPMPTSYDAVHTTIHVNVAPEPTAVAVAPVSTPCNDPISTITIDGAATVPTDGSANGANGVQPSVVVVVVTETLGNNQPLPTPPPSVVEAVFEPTYGNAQPSVEAASVPKPPQLCKTRQ